MEYFTCGDDMNSRLWEILRKQGVSQTKLSEITGIRQSEISQIVNDKKPNLSLRIALKIAKALNTKVEYIWYDWLD